MSIGLTVLQALASLFSVAMCLSSSPAIYNIHKNRDIGEVALLPLVGLWLNCRMLMLYGWATSDFFPLFATFLFGEIVAIVYISVYFRWTKKRAYAVKAIGVSFIIVVLSALYTILAMTGATGQSSDSIGLTTGYMMAVGSVLLYITPFETIVHVLWTRSGVSIPMWMCLAGATANGLWIIDGLLVGDVFVFLLAVVCTALGLLQVVPYFVFHPSKQSASSSAATGHAEGSKDDKYVLPMTVPAATLETAVASPVFIAVRSPLEPVP